MVRWRRVVGGIAGTVCAAALVLVVAARDLGRRLQQRLHRARDLRRRRQHHLRRERQDRRRQGRERGIGRADAAGQGSGRAAHRKPRLPGLPRRRDLHDPPAGADRREVRRLPAHAAARGRHAAAAAAAQDPGGQEGAGQYLLPVQNTHSPVDVDLLGDINRLPERQRFTIILNELGAGLAGRGSDLSAVIRRANPALQELDKVLAILAGENKVLAKLAVDSDKALAPFAAFANASPTSSCRATRSRRRAPPRAARSRATWSCSRPSSNSSARRWNGCSASPNRRPPTFTDLKAAAPGLNKAFTSLPAFSAAPKSSSRTSARPRR